LTTSAPNDTARHAGIVRRRMNEQLLPSELPDDTATGAATFMVITPAFNAERWIEEAVRSVMAQTFADWEMVVIDNGSSDRTGEIVEALLDDPRLRLIRNPTNRPVSVIRNEIAATVESAYLVMLDADDRLLPSFLERTSAEFDRDPNIAVVSPDALLLDASSGGHFDFTLMESRWWKAPRRVKPGGMVAALATRDFLYAGAAVRRETFVALGGLDPELFGCMDWDLWIRVAASGREVSLIREPLAEYRVHSGSLSRPNSDQVASNLLTNVARMFEQLSARGDLQSHERTALRRSLARVRRHALMADSRAALLAGDRSRARRLAIKAFTTFPRPRSLAVVLALGISPGWVRRKHESRVAQAQETGNVIGFGPSRDPRLLRGRRRPPRDRTE
jgi:GT2 family glycosyltransferase